MGFTAKGWVLMSKRKSLVTGFGDWRGALVSECVPGAEIAYMLRRLSEEMASARARHMDPYDAFARAAENVAQEIEDSSRVIPKPIDQRAAEEIWARTDTVTRVGLSEKPRKRFALAADHPRCKSSMGWPFLKRLGF